MKRSVRYYVREGDGREIAPVGRDAWMLDRLLAAGKTGCTTLENPAPRTSHYVWKLRTKFGLNIETITEEHDGPYAGTHARYLLRSEVERLTTDDPRPSRTNAEPPAPVTP